MSRSVGPPGEVTTGAVTNPASRIRYEIAARDGAAVLSGRRLDGGTRRQRIVGRIGAGIFDTSWAGAELDGAGAVTRRLFFAPLETLAGHGLALSPFERHPESAGMDLALTPACLTCHTGDVAGVREVPANALGAAAFERLHPLGCAACHGATARHLELMARPEPPSSDDIGLRRLARMAPGAQRDVCARCHLQGDARIELAAPADDAPLTGRIPVLVPARALEDDFRFVGQLERLALSACFRNSPAMTCTTCHRPHAGVAEQGRAGFVSACRRCHAELAPEHASARERGVRPRERIEGHADDCVECHVRRSAPFDLPHVRSADHFIRRRIAPPRLDVPHRAFADPAGELVLFDDGRLEPALATPEGRRWEAGVRAIGLLPMLRVKEAAALFARFPAPGTPEAIRAAAPPGLVALETSPAFHTARGLALMATGAIDAARAAFADATLLDPRAAEPRLARARLALGAGDVRTAMVETQAVIDAHPAAEEPWDIRAALARRVGRPDLELSALEASVERWPSNAAAWLALLELAEARGDAERARRARLNVLRLEPSRLGAPKAGAPKN
jgi:hypothetical protein